MDHQHRTLAQALAWDDEVLESTHDYIQWWFPLTEPSAFNGHAPVASRAEFEELQHDERVRDGVMLAMHRMLRFYGLCLEVSGVIKKTDEWNWRSQNWASRQSHNDLRITRILKSLCLLGHRAHAEALLATLEEIIREERDQRNQVPLRFWREALL
ncbi:opioid growth factor receptor-related protein [Chitinivorax sp. B]|uniref:opioid growth factor receptor-related protein n=1 Tax=Chitinivorax sp. B TaxID=2502235 RepID=UPI001485B69C|nr:opioid growth factor receptor-related protein [Chitinivorax sp. B]